MDHYETAAAALAAAPDTFQGIRAIYVLGRRVVVVSDDGAFMLQGRDGDRYWTRMRSYEMAEAPQG